MGGAAGPADAVYGPLATADWALWGLRELTSRKPIMSTSTTNGTGSWKSVRFQAQACGELIQVEARDKCST